MMSGNDILVKGNIVRRASSFEEWRRAPRPNYESQGNLDLEFPYSEYPGNEPYQYYSVPLPRQISTRILDFWGEGRIEINGLITGFRGAYNVNHQFQLVSNGADKGKKIPNRIPTIDYKSVNVKNYVLDGSFDIITLMGAPIIDSTAAEIARIISGNSNSLVVTYGFYETDEDITKLKSELDAKKLIILAGYCLPRPLNEITLNPHLAFCPLNLVVSEAISYFLEENISSCANILCSLQRNLYYHISSASEALHDFFNDDRVKNSYRIFALGYELDKAPDGKAVVENYMNTNVVKIVRSDYTSLQLQSSYGKEANLCPYAKVGSGSWQWGTFANSGYGNDGDKLAFVRDITRSIHEFKIKADYGSASYLCSKNVESDSFQYAFFGTASYNQSYKDGQYFRLYPVSGGEKFKVEANFGERSYLCVDEVNHWEYAFFGTRAYISDSGCSQGETLKIIFH